MFCGTVMSGDLKLPDLNKHRGWDDLIKETKTVLYGAVDHSSNIAECYINSDSHLLQRSQSECFPEELNALRTGKSLPKSSKLLPLFPEYDPELCLIIVGG